MLFRSRVAVPKVPFSRAQGSSSSPTELEETAQQVIAARKRKLRSEGPAETPLPLLVSHKRKSTSPPEKADSYESGISMPSSDSQASLDLETNVGYVFYLTCTSCDFCFCFHRLCYRLLTCLVSELGPAPRSLSTKAWLI